MAIILGLDIDPRSVRGVVLKTALRNSQVLRYLAAPIAPTDPADPDAKRAATSEAIRQVLAGVGQPADRVITELSGDEVSIRQVSFPAKVAKRVDDLLPHELEGKVPFELDESIIDHQKIDVRDGELRLLAAVAPKASVERHLADMSSLGLDPREVAVGAVALDGLIALLPALATPGPHCVIDIHLEGTDVCIVQNGACQFGRTISVGIPELDSGRQPVLEREIRQTLAAWRMEGGTPLSSVHVCGAMATREGVDVWLTPIVGTRAEVLRLPAAPGADEAGRPAFGRAAALAGRALSRTSHLDARQGEFAAKQAANALRQHLPLAAGCVAVILVAFVFASYARYSALAERNEALKDELSRVTEDYFGTGVTSPDQATRMIARGARGSDPMPLLDAYGALAAMSEAIPTEVTHDVQQLQIDLGDGEETGRFMLRGTVDSVSDTEVVLRALRDHRVVRSEGSIETRLACFHELELGNTTSTADERRSYRLNGQVRCRDEDAPEEEPSDDRRSRGRRGSN